MYAISLSVFFPCYNEEKNLEGLVQETMQVLDNLVQQYEILIINDGSQDNTRLIADGFSEKYNNVRVIHHQKNEGYGAAVISGFNNSTCEWVFFTDGDHQFFINEIELLLAEIDRYDAIIGFRKKRQDPYHRIIYARMLNMFIRLLFNLKVKDLNCAFKLIKRKVLKNITLQCSAGLINTELLLKLKRSGVSIREIGVSHKPRLFGSQTGGSIKVIRKAFLDLFKLYRIMRKQ
jgi:glycosyltransferase involved in cell wall biosynthesis